MKESVSARKDKTAGGLLVLLLELENDLVAGRSDDVIRSEEELSGASDDDGVDGAVSCHRGRCWGVDKGRVHGCPDRASVELYVDENKK